jgi:hypothetical protein
MLNTSGKFNTHGFYPKHLNQAVIPKPDFDGYRSEQHLVGEDEHQMPDQPST